jgi:hypothetical protein
MTDARCDLGCSRTQPRAGPHNAPPSGQLQERDAQLRELAAKLAAANELAAGDAGLRKELAEARAALAACTQELAAAKGAFEQRMCVGGAGPPGIGAAAAALGGARPGQAAGQAAFLSPAPDGSRQPSTPPLPYRRSELETSKQELVAAVEGNSSDAEAARARCAAAEAARAEAEARWRAAYEELAATKQNLESAQ